MNWTEILARGGVPDAPGYQELLARIREEKEGAPLPEKKRSKRKSGKHLK
jgi:hypothetical protein